MSNNLYDIIGPRGERGEIGPGGPPGYNGRDGMQGERGHQGIMGEPGPRGIQGEIGIQGIQGIMGPTGINGSIGTTGPVGERGIQGLLGNTGARGQNLYVQYKLSIKRLIEGIHKNTNDNFWKNLRNTLYDKLKNNNIFILNDEEADTHKLIYKLEQSNKQIQFSIEPGQGTNDYTFNTNDLYMLHLDERYDDNIYFTKLYEYISKANTGPVGSKGNDGTDGLRGPTGTTGNKGSNGNIGPTGPRGIRGSQGVVGGKGNPGDGGAQGDAGTNGLNGETGPTGCTGIIGATGSIGCTGIMGATGPKGNVFSYSWSGKFFSEIEIFKIKTIPFSSDFNILLKNLHNLSLNNSIIILNRYFNKDGTLDRVNGFDLGPIINIDNLKAGGLGLINILSNIDGVNRSFIFSLANTDFNGNDLLSSFDNASLIITKTSIGMYKISKLDYIFQRSLFLLNGSNKSNRRGIAFNEEFVEDLKIKTGDDNAFYPKSGLSLTQNIDKTKNILNLSSLDGDIRIGAKNDISINLNHDIYLDCSGIYYNSKTNPFIHINGDSSLNLTFNDGNNQIFKLDVSHNNLKMNLANNDVNGVPINFNINEGSTIFSGSDNINFNHKDNNNIDIKAFVNINGKVSKNNGPSNFFKPNEIGSSNEEKDYSLWVSNAIAAQELHVFSDKRIKTNVKNIEEEKILRLISDIELKEYNYIDVISRGSDNVYGFIAQQVESIYPQATFKTSEYIPNIYQKSTNYTINGNVLSVILEKEKHVDIGKFVKVITNKYEVLSLLLKDIVLNKMVFYVELSDIEKINNSNELFLFGSYVDDFTLLNKEKIQAIMFGGIQAIIKENKLLKTKLEKMENDINTLKNK